MSDQKINSQSEQKLPSYVPNSIFYPFYQYPPAPCPHYPCYLTGGYDHHPSVYKPPEQLPHNNEALPLPMPFLPAPRSQVKVEVVDLVEAEEKSKSHEGKNGEEKGLSCQCVKSHCLKQYCYCFKNGSACGEKCGCSSCQNTQDELNEKRYAIRRKRVTCRCSKSQCQKKYCECYTAQKKCEETCRCIGCEN